ncbi:OsmC family protein [Rhodococcus sp. TAF43]|uniref:OsmC family protein n=1 Tax=unclassified Rhodococcus (in: high G+C Gram-positive bacteria) TaxID=192944 RepID=UPI000E0A4364|nr:MULTISPECIES: OsmC family protein [unclassified Rhodococcus (in: high G+C Gram-positive bacteria)]QKT13459.1 OsmC family protein [Rhodococcus sp. W8901]RDI24879.1 putative OsmC-like protein [Rhodococcus sp. AG1013]
MTTASVSHLSSIVSATADAVSRDAAKANVVFRASARAHDAVASTVSLGKYTVEVDEPPALGGENTAPNPVEYYLASLLSCHVVTYRFWAEKLGIRVDDITARAEGDLDVRGFFGFDETVRPGFGEVRVVVNVTGPESRERYLELHEAAEAHCPVLDLTRNPTPVTSVLETPAANG